MKRILCYGDSNTWGTRPDGLGRWEKRWPISLKEELGDEWVIVEEGCGGRTTVWDDPLEMHKNGRTYLLPCLHSHRPLDAVVIALGTNDLKCRFSLTPYDIAAGAGELAKEVLRCEYGHGYPVPKVLLIAPAPLGNNLMKSPIGKLFDENAVKKSCLLAEEYREMAAALGVEFLDAGEYAVTGEDEVHYDEASHIRLAKAAADRLREMLADD